LQTLAAIHARLRSILSAAEYLDGSELHCFRYDTQLQQFVSTEQQQTIIIKQDKSFDVRLYI
jgi:hypothetical protein